MRIPPFLDLLEHEAMPSWRTRAFWFAKKLPIAMPALMIGFVIALYILATVKLAATVLYAAAPGEGLREFALLLDHDVASGWGNLHEAILYLACIYIGENIARAALEIAALRPFAEENAARFMRAAFGTAALVAATIIMRIAEPAFDLPPIDSGAAIILFGVLASACFASLSLAFRQGAALKKEQDLTV